MAVFRAIKMFIILISFLSGAIVINSSTSSNEGTLNVTDTQVPGEGSAAITSGNSTGELASAIDMHPNASGNSTGETAAVIGGLTSGNDMHSNASGNSTGETAAVIGGLTSGNDMHSNASGNSTGEVTSAFGGLTSEYDMHPNASGNSTGETAAVIGGLTSGNDMHSNASGNSTGEVTSAFGGLTSEYDMHPNASGNSTGETAAVIGGLTSGNDMHSNASGNSTGEVTSAFGGLTSEYDMHPNASGKSTGETAAVIGGLTSGNDMHSNASGNSTGEVTSAFGGLTSEYDMHPNASGNSTAVALSMGGTNGSHTSFQDQQNMIDLNHVGDNSEPYLQGTLFIEEATTSATTNEEVSPDYSFFSDAHGNVSMPAADGAPKIPGEDLRASTGIFGACDGCWSFTFDDNPISTYDTGQGSLAAGMDLYMTGNVTGEQLDYADTYNQTFNETYGIEYVSRETEIIQECTSPGHHCLHGGYCKASEQPARCLCRSGFLGNRCEHIPADVITGPYVTIEAYNKTVGHAIVPGSITLQTFDILYGTLESWGKTAILGENYTSPVQVPIGPTCYVDREYFSEPCFDGVTYSVWVKVTNGNENSGCIFSFDSCLGCGISASLSNGNSIYLKVKSSGILYGPLIVPVELLVWNNIIITAGKAGVSLYLNGRKMTVRVESVELTWDENFGNNFTLFGGCGVEQTIPHVLFGSLSVWFLEFADETAISMVFTEAALVPSAVFTVDIQNQSLLIRTDGEMPQEPALNAFTLSANQPYLLLTNNEMFPCLSDIEKCDIGMTLMMWIRSRDTTQRQRYIVGGGLELTFSSDWVRWTIIKDNKVMTATIEGRPPENAWFQFTLTYHSATNAMDIFINEYLIPANKTTVALTWTSTLPNRRYYGDPAGTDSLNFDMGHIFAWDHGKSQDFIKTFYQNQAKVPVLPNITAGSTTTQTSTIPSTTTTMTTTTTKLPTTTTGAPIVPCLKAELSSDFRNVTNPQVVLRSSRIKLEVLLERRCGQSIVQVSWRLENATWHFNTTYAVTIHHNMYRTKFSTSSSKLQAGTYSLTCTVSNAAGDTAEDKIYLRIEASDLKTGIKGGTVRTVQWGGLLTIDGRKKTTDPDLGNKQDKSGMSFTWTCLQYTAAQESRSLECEQLRATGVAHEPGILVVDTARIESGRYEFQMTVIKDVRSASARQTIVIVDATVPEINIRCLVNCDAQVVASRKFSLVAECASCQGSIASTLTFEWSLKRVTGGNISAIWDLAARSLTGTSGSGLVIKAGGLEVGESFCLQLKTACSSCEASLSEYCFTTNRPPAGGTCDISPANGTALTTQFTISCSGWRDDGEASSALSYRYEVETETGARQAVYAGTSPLASGVRLNSGPASGNHSVRIIATVLDVLGAGAETILMVKVESPQFASTTDGGGQQEALVENVAALTMGSGSALSELLEQGDNSRAAQLITAAAGLLNALPSVSTTSDSAGSSSNTGQEEDKTALKELRRTLITQVAAMSSQVESVDDVRAVTQALSSTTEVSGQVSDTSLVEVSSALTNLANTSDSLIAERPEEAVNLATPLLNVVGNVLRGVQPPSTTTTSTTQSEGGNNQGNDDQDLSPEEKALQAAQEVERQESLRQAEVQKASEITPGVLQAEKRVLRALLQTLAPGETPVQLSTSASALNLQRRQASDISNRTTTVGRVALGFGSRTGQNDTRVLDLSTTSFSVNPFPWIQGADYVTSDVFRLDVTDEAGNDADIDDSISMTFETTAPEAVTVNPSNSSSDVAVHKITINSADAALATKFTVDGSHSQVTLYLRKGASPTPSTYDVMEVVTGRQVGEDQTEVQLTLAPERMEGAGVYYLIIDTPVPLRQKRSLADSENTTDSGNTTNAGLSYSVTLTTSACRTLDTSTNTWTTTGCSVGAGSTIDHTECSCQPTADRKSFGVSFIAPPNLIDFSTVFAKFAQLADNAAVFSTVAALLGVYVLLAVWAHRQDTKDRLWAEMKPLSDNHPADHAVYIVTVETGYKISAGTSANVAFVIAGSYGDTGMRSLSAEGEMVFPRGKSLTFYVTTPVHLGQVKTLRIWHDGLKGGRSNAWYLNKITVEDPQENKTYTFLCNQWLAIDRGDGHLERILSAASHQETTRFSYLFGQNSRIKLAEHHMWASVFYMPIRTNFTRVQRLSCCLCFLFLSMITSAMFYRTEDNVERPQVVRLGPFSFSTQELFVSIITMLIVFPVNILIIQIFRKTRTVDQPCQRKDKIAGQDAWANVTSTTSLSLLTSDSASQSTEAKEDKLWPSWLRVVAWMLLALSVVTSAFFVILYSLDWGAEKANQWLTAFVLSFIEQVFFMDPIKVFAIALFVTFLLRKTAVEKNDETTPVDDFNELETVILTQEEILERRRQEELTRTAARSLARDTVMVCLLGVLVFSLSYITADTNSFNVRTSIKSAMLDGSSGFLNGVYDQKSYFTWLQTVFLPNFFVETDVNGARLSWRERRFLSDRASHRLGPARLRQLRWSTVNCTQVLKPCLSDLPNHAPFGQAIDSSTSASQTSTAWKYSPPDSGVRTSGRLADYPAGGYICQLGVSSAASQARIDELLAGIWLDRWTRAVILEFNIYNANVNLLARTALVAEFPSTGGALTSGNIDVFRVHAVGLNGIYTRVCEVLFALMTLYNLIMLLITVIREKCRPELGFLLLMDVSILFTSLYMVVIFAVRFVTMAEVMEQYRAQPLVFVDFGASAWYDRLYRDGWGFMTLFVTLKLCALLRLNQRFARLGYILRHMVRPMLHYVCQSSILFVAFLTTAYLWYGRSVYDLSNPTRVATSLLLVALGSFDVLDEMLAVDRLFTYFFFSMLVIMVNLVLANTLVSVVLDSHDTFVDADLLCSKDYELIRFLKNDVHSFISKHIRPKEDSD